MPVPGEDDQRMGDDRTCKHVCALRIIASPDVVTVNSYHSALPSSPTLPTDSERLVMAKMLFDPPNFLVLDEPANHLDMATKEMLIAALWEFEGTMLFVSHDRHFLAALSNRVLELTFDGAHQYGGGCTEHVTRTGHEAQGLYPMISSVRDARVRVS